MYIRDEPKEGKVPIKKEEIERLENSIRTWGL